MVEFMASELPMQNKKEPDQAELELKIAKEIKNMPIEVQDRFKAIKVLND